VNNDHLLYWGEASKYSDEGIEFLFQVIEQTEFIDDASFQPFKGIGVVPTGNYAITKIKKFWQIHLYQMAQTVFQWHRHTAAFEYYFDLFQEVRWNRTSNDVPQPS
jgi:hypothetical protein